MNTTTATLTINLAGTITIDVSTLQQLLAGTQIQAPAPAPAPQPPRPTVATKMVYSTNEAAELLGVDLNNHKALFGETLLAIRQR